MANRDGTCRACGSNLAGPKPIPPLTLTAHLRAEPFCRQTYLDFEAGTPGQNPHLIAATLHIVQQVGYMHWKIMGLMAGGWLETLGEAHLRRDARKLLAKEQRKAGLTILALPPKGKCAIQGECSLLPKSRAD